jgi:hypothetical protein
VINNPCPMLLKGAGLRSILKTCYKHVSEHQPISSGIRPWRRSWWRSTIHRTTRDRSGAQRHAQSCRGLKHMSISTWSLPDVGGGGLLTTDVGQVGLWIGICDTLQSQNSVMRHREPRREKAYSEAIVDVIVVGLGTILGVSRVRAVVAPLPVNVHEASGKCWPSALNTSCIDSKYTYLVVNDSFPGRRNPRNIFGVPYLRTIRNKTGALSQRTDLTSSE